MIISRSKLKIFKFDNLADKIKMILNKKIKRVPRIKVNVFAMQAIPSLAREANQLPTLLVVFNFIILFALLRAE